MSSPAGSPEGGLLFRWETLRQVGTHPLNYRPPVPGKMCEVELIGGQVIRVWRADDGQSYFCHGLTFGGKEAPGGPVSPFTGQSVEVILREYYRVLDPETLAKPGDICVWMAPGVPESTPHSAVLVEPVVVPGQNYLDYSSKLRTKNGMSPETVMTLEDLVGLYGETYNVFTRK